MNDKIIKPLRRKDFIDAVAWFLKFLAWTIVGVFLVLVFLSLLLSAIRGPEEFAFTVLRLALFVITIVLALVILNVGYRINTDYYEKSYHESSQKAVETFEAFLKKPSEETDLNMLKPYLRHLDLAEIASQSFREKDQERLKKAFIKLGAGDGLENAARHSRRKWIQLQSLLLIGWLKSSDNISVLNDALYDPDASISFAAGEALSRFNSDVAYTILLDALNEGRLARSRIAAIIESSAYQDVVPLLSERVKDPRAEVRFWIAYLLGRSHDQRALPILFELVHDDSADVRASVAESLGELGINEDIKNTLRDLLKDYDWPVRIHAAKTVGKLKIGELTEDLIPLLRDTEWWVRQNSAIALEKLGKPAAPLLIRQLDSDDRFARNKSAEILGRIGYITEQINNLSAGGEEAAKAHDFLIAIGHAEAIHIIEEEAIKAKPEIQSQLVEIMVEIGDIGALPVLKQLSDSASPSVRDQAKKAIDDLRRAA